jgi:hypothetical protein
VRGIAASFYEADITAGRRKFLSAAAA